MNGMLAILVGAVAFASGSRLIIQNPTSPATDVLTVSSADEKYTRTWKPARSGDTPDKRGRLIWREAYALPKSDKFLLLKHVVDYEDDNVTVTIERIHGASVPVGDTSFPANNGLNVFLSKDGKCLHFRAAIDFETPTDHWARICFDVNTGKRIEKKGTVETDIGVYVPIQISR